MNFKLEAFEQDIGNLIATLQRLELSYQLISRSVTIKEKGQPEQLTMVKIPRFSLEQFLGRLCLVIEELQLANATPENEGLIARCPEHGHEAEGGKFIYFNDRAFCLVCLCERNECEAGWSAPDNDEGEEPCEEND